MRALTVWQPWASLLATGNKKNETRSWNTNIRGPVAIHAAKKPIKEVIPLMDPEAVKLVNRLLYPALLGQLPTGCVVGTGNLVDCILITKEYIKTLSREEILLGDYTPGRYAWVFENFRLLSTPVPTKGDQGFWNWEGGGIDG
ncbi:ASCH domain-containing protein [Tepidibacillus marianensis]|uniref:ASCH domain-containing protein n=1 Tax=Tepidibacillus marianensis TaxID=3131995 RepID=UPI0030CF2F7D